MSVWRPASRRRRRWYWKRKEGGLDINKGYPESTQIDGILAIPAYTEMIIIFKTPTDHISWKPHLKWSCWWTNMPMGPILVFHAQTWDKILRQVLHLTVVVFVESTKCHINDTVSGKLALELNIMSVHGWHKVYLPQTYHFLATFSVTPRFAWAWLSLARQWGYFPWPIFVMKGQNSICPIHKDRPRQSTHTSGPGRHCTPKLRIPAKRDNQNPSETNSTNHIFAWNMYNT